jgi:hypothetical protein
MTLDCFQNDLDPPQSHVRCLMHVKHFLLASAAWCSWVCQKNCGFVSGCFPADQGYRYSDLMCVQSKHSW